LQIQKDAGAALKSGPVDHYESSGYDLFHIHTH
jgi:hypothetical protein